MTMSILSPSSAPTLMAANMEPPQVGQADGTKLLSNALQPGYDATQSSLGALLNGVDRGRLNMSEGEKAALQMQVSQFGALVTLAMNVSLGMGKAIEKLQQG